MNNFDESSSGINIEAFVYYDNGQSQWRFEKNFTHIVGDTYWYKTYDGIPKPECFEDLFTIEQPELQTSLDILHEQFYYNNDLTEDDFDKDRAWEEVIGNFSFPKDLSDFVEMLENYDINHTKSFERTVSHGYSQSDSAEIFVPIKIRENYGLADEDDLIGNVKEDIDHFLWDSPLVVRITINEEEYCSDLFDSGYDEYDMDEFIKEILNYFVNDGLDMELLQSELEGLLPDEPSYN